MYYHNESIRYADAIVREQAVQRRLIEGMEQSRYARLQFVASLLALNLREHAMRVGVAGEEARERRLLGDIRTRAARSRTPPATARRPARGCGTPTTARRSRSFESRAHATTAPQAAPAVSPGGHGGEMLRGAAAAAPGESRSFRADELSSTATPAPPQQQRVHARLAQDRWVFLREERLARAEVVRLEGVLWGGVLEQRAKAIPAQPRARFPLTPRCAREGISNSKDSAAHRRRQQQHTATATTTPNRTSAAKENLRPPYNRDVHSPTEVAAGGGRGACGSGYTNTPLATAGAGTGTGTGCILPSHSHPHHGAPTVASYLRSGGVGTVHVPGTPPAGAYGAQGRPHVTPGAGVPGGKPAASAPVTTTTTTTTTTTSKRAKEISERLYSTPVGNVKGVKAGQQQQQQAQPLQHTPACEPTSNHPQPYYLAPHGGVLSTARRDLPHALATPQQQQQLLGGGAGHAGDAATNSRAAAPPTPTTHAANGSPLARGVHESGGALRATRLDMSAGRDPMGASLESGVRRCYHDADHELDVASPLVPTPIMAPTPIREGIETDPHLPEAAGAGGGGGVCTDDVVMLPTPTPTRRRSRGRSASRGPSLSRHSPMDAPTTPPPMHDLTQRLHSQLRRECRQVSAERHLLRAAMVECREQELRSCILGDEINARGKVLADMQQCPPPPPEAFARAAAAAAAVVPAATGAPAPAPAAPTTSPSTTAGASEAPVPSVDPLSAVPSPPSPAPPAAGWVPVYASIAFYNILFAVVVNLALQYTGVL